MPRVSRFQSDCRSREQPTNLIWIFLQRWDCIYHNRPQRFIQVHSQYIYCQYNCIYKIRFPSKGTQTSNCFSSSVFCFRLIHRQDILSAAYDPTTQLAYIIDDNNNVCTTLLPFLSTKSLYLIAIYSCTHLTPRSWYCPAQYPWRTTLWILL